MRNIKYRGVDSYNGKKVYGDFFLFAGSLPTIVVPNGLTLIEEGSLAQLVGLDKKGREVYEGDEVKNPVDGTTFKAAMNHICTVKAYELVAERSDCNGRKLD